MNATAQKIQDQPGVKRAYAKFMVSQMERAEHARPHFRIIIEDLNTTRENVLSRDIWANVGDILKGPVHGGKPFPVVELIWADGSRYMEVLVITAERLWAVVRELRYIEFGDAARDIQDARNGESGAAYVLRWKGPTHGWAVQRVADKEDIFEHKDKATAQAWLDDYLKALK